jgi:hypothetical protein
LEALHPGVLRQILVEHIERYRDDDLDDRVEDAVEQYREDLDRAAAQVRSRHAEELAALDHQRDAIRERFGEARAAAQAAHAAVADPAHAAYDAIVQPAQATYEAIVAAARRDLDAVVTEAQDRLTPLIQQAFIANVRIVEDARDEIEAMEQSFVAEAEPLITQINAEFDGVVPDPDEYDWPEPTADEWDNPLFDSKRDYVEQVDVYRKHRGDDEDVGLAVDRPVTKTCECCGETFETIFRHRRLCSERCKNRKRRERRRDGGSSQSKEKQSTQTAKPGAST